jgi:Protein of unknown function (DUF3551)
MRTIVAATALLAGTIAGGAARAEINYPWCMTQADGRESCSFTSFEQCRSAAMGKSAICSQNPRYQGPPKR